MLLVAKRRISLNEAHVREAGWQETEPDCPAMTIIVGKYPMNRRAAVAIAFGGKKRLTLYGT